MLMGLVKFGNIQIHGHTKLMENGLMQANCTDGLSSWSDIISDTTCPYPICGSITLLSGVQMN